MDISFLKPLYHGSGPWCSVYLSTARTKPRAEHEIELRWNELRGRLAELGAPTKDLRAIDDEVGADVGVPGPHGQAIFAAHGSVELVRELPAPQIDSRAVLGELPDLAPLLAQARDLGPHLVVFADRSGADVEVHGCSAPRPERERVDGPARALSKVSVGDWREDHNQRRAENSWQENARAVAARVEQIAGEHAAGMIALSGDVRMRAAVSEELGPLWRSRAVELAGSDAPGADADLVRRDAARAAAEFEQAWRAETVDRYASGLAHGKAVEGLEAVVESLRAGEVETLLVRQDAPDGGAPVWWGPERGQLAVHAEELEATHAAQLKRSRAVDALIRAAALEDGGLLLFDGGEPGPREAVGAILRRG
ncbi:MAG TPA: Vms1/Ankzf1 family peptidyl-tRNA hydrolase [Actinospica sp.]|jgi:hypothetical protein|nr:Vms1/Ankzf1 family peptidyl-tRNA hydrolase [Actinospica sp.]